MKDRGANLFTIHQDTMFKVYLKCQEGMRGARGGRGIDVCVYFHPDLISLTDYTALFIRALMGFNA